MSLLPTTKRRHQKCMQIYTTIVRKHNVADLYGLSAILSAPIGNVHVRSKHLK